MPLNLNYHEQSALSNIYNRVKQLEEFIAGILQDHKHDTLHARIKRNTNSILAIIEKYERQK